jgi:hypothetical protein
VYRAPPNLLERLGLERSGCNKAEDRDRQRYEKHREARRQHARERRRRRKPDGLISNLEPVQTSGKTAPEAVITDAKDPDQLRELATLARERIAKHRRNHPPRSGPKRVSRLLRRLQREDPECFAALRSDLRAMAWELSGRGWTDTIYSGHTIRAALELLEPERAAV